MSSVVKRPAAFLTRAGQFAFAVATMVGALSAAPRAALAEDEVSRAKNQLKDMNSLVDEVSLHVERHDLGRIMVLRNAANDVSASIDTVGLANMGTLGKYQILIVGYRYSTEYFQRIATRRTQGAITQLQSIVDIVAHERGFDQFSRITESIFRQMHKLVSDLIELPLDPVLQQKLVALIAPLGRTIAISAANGDQVEATMDAGRATYHQVAEVYADFDRVSVGDAAFNMVINIHGLNEFYADWTHLPR